MAKTINFCGDSFCNNSSNKSWTTQLSELLDYKIIGLGKIGTSHEHAIQSFNSKADITVFCWTEPHRLWHTKYPINMAVCDKYRKENSFYEVAYQFYKVLHETNHFIDRQYRDLYWFDHEVLSKYSGTIIHLWNFSKTYNFIHGNTVKGTLTPPSVFFKEPDTENINHLSIEENKLLSKKLYKLLRNLNG